jgi:hypothetical protein
MLKYRADKASTVKNRSGKVRIREVGVGEVRAVEARSDEIGINEVCSSEVRSSEVGPIEDRTGEVDRSSISVRDPPTNHGEGGLNIGSCDSVLFLFATPGLFGIPLLSMRQLLA